MTWGDGIGRTVLRLEHANRALLPMVALAVHNSIVFGSAITGAPGQVVADVAGGNLRDSFQLTFPTADSAKSATNVVYAESNEDGIARPGGGPYIQRSATGGRHSVSKTRDGFPLLVADAVAQLKAGA